MEEAVLYASVRTRVSRIPAPAGGGTAIRKQVHGPDAAARIQHERAVLDRLAGLSGVPRLLATDDPAALLLADPGGQSLAEVLEDGPLDPDAVVALAVDLRVISNWPAHPALISEQDSLAVQAITATPGRTPTRSAATCSPAYCGAACAVGGWTRTGSTAGPATAAATATPGLTKADRRARKPADRLARDFAPPGRINQRWVSDLTQIDTGEGVLYLASILDLASRRVVGYALGGHHDADLAAAAVQVAIATRGGRVAGVVLHTDYAEFCVKPRDRGMACAGRVVLSDSSA